jgi:hypothetical protein
MDTSVHCTHRHKHIHIHMIRLPAIYSLELPASVDVDAGTRTPHARKLTLDGYEPTEEHVQVGFP